MRSRSFLFTVVLVALLLAGLGAQGIWAQQPPREETGPKEPLKGEAEGILTEDLTGPLTAEDLAYTLTCGDMTVSNPTFTGAEVAAGVFQGGEGIIGFDTGIILSTGNIANVVGPNTVENIGVANNTNGDSDLDTLSGFPTHDAAVLEFDFVPQTTEIQFRYVFASDEYNEYVGSNYNDVFAFYVNGQNCAVIDSTPISINTVNGTQNSSFYINNDLASGAALDTEMDGLTTVLTCVATVNPDQTNHVKLAIADATDFVYDAVVFIEQCSFKPAECCTADNCPDDPELSKDCETKAPPFYVVANRDFENLDAPGTGCQPIILNHPECTDCCNLQDEACAAADADVQDNVCPMLAEKVAWDSLGSVTIYQMCCGESKQCGGDGWAYRVRALQPDGTCPLVDETCYSCLPPGTGVKLPAPLIAGGLAVLAAGFLAVGLVVRRRAER